jgi:hypothetical protein
MYKGVELFGEFADDASSGKFPKWQIKVRIALKRNFPVSIKCISRSSQDLQAELGRAVSAASSAEAAHLLRLEHEDAQLDAAGHLLLLRTPQLAGPQVQERIRTVGLPCGAARGLAALLMLAFQADSAKNLKAERVTKKRSTKTNAKRAIPHQTAV